MIHSWVWCLQHRAETKWIKVCWLNERKHPACVGCYRGTRLFSLSQKNRKPRPRLGPSCWEETAITVHYPESEDKSQDGTPMVRGSRFGVLLWRRLELGRCLGSQGGSYWWDITQKLRERRVLPCLSLSWGPAQSQRDTSVTTSGCRVLGVVPSLQFLPLKAHLEHPMPCFMSPPKARRRALPTPKQRGGAQVCKSCDQRRVTSPETSISLIHASNKIALHFS